MHFKVGRLSSRLCYVEKHSDGYCRLSYTKCRALDLLYAIYMGILTKNSHFSARSVMFLRLVCILKLEGLLQGYVKWKNTMTGNVNFLTQNVGPWTCYKQFIWGY